MQLQQVNRVSLQIPQAALDPRRQILAVVALRGLLCQPASRLGGDIKLFLSFLFEAREQSFAAAVAVDIGGVKKIHSAIERRVEGGQRFPVIHIAPRASDRPRAKTDFRDLPASASKESVFHAK